MGNVTLLAVTGLQREARIIVGSGLFVLAGGGASQALAIGIDAMLAQGCDGVISIGIAGALAPDLKVGDAVVATAVIGDGVAYPADARWAGRIATAIAGAQRGTIAGSDAMLVDAAAKAALRAATGALCVDMESHLAAKAAHATGLPFAALRFISDSADRALPKAAQRGMKPDGGMDILAVLGSLAADPRQLPALIRTGAEAETAFDALRRGRRRLGPALGFADV